MSRRATVVSLIAATWLGAVTLVAWAQSKPEEGSLTLDKLPAAVKATVLKETAGGQIKEIEAETKGGKTIYEVEFVRNGKVTDLIVAADGTLLGAEEEDAPATQPAEQEREVKESEVPPAALATLKKLAGESQIIEFAEEIEHGSKLYEGTWKTATGSNVDTTVTPTGDVMEIEEQVSAEQVPAAVTAAVRKLAGEGAQLHCEKKTALFYEVKFRKDGQRYEILYAPDGRVIEQAMEKAAQGAKPGEDQDD